MYEAVCSTCLSIGTHASCQVTRLAMAAAIALLAGGCANLDPVKTYADETKKFSATFATMPDTTVARCRSRVMLGEQTLTAYAKFKVNHVRQLTNVSCAEIIDQRARIMVLANLLGQYADTLTALVDGKLPDYKAELDGLEGAMTGLKDGNGKAIITLDQTSAIIALGKMLARVATTRAARMEVRDLLDHGAGVDATLDAMKWYVRMVLRPTIAQYTHDVDILIKVGLPVLETKEPLGTRAVMVSLDAERERLARIDVATSDFLAAAERLRQARTAVRDQLDHPRIAVQPSNWLRL